MSAFELLITKLMQTSSKMVGSPVFLEHVPALRRAR